MLVQGISIVSDEAPRNASQKLKDAGEEKDQNSKKELFSIIQWMPKRRTATGAGYDMFRC